MALDASVLMEEAKCYNCAGISNVETMTLALVRRWLLSIDPGADTSPENLLEYAACYCASGTSMFEKLFMALLAMIAEAA